MIDIRLSKEFKTQATKAVISIVFFGLTYVLILLCAIGLTVLCAYLGIMLIVTLPKIITILLGIGLASLGFFVLIFLLKFLFKSSKVDRSNLQEIKKENEPALFNMIQEIVTEVKTSFPKKVYLSAEVNAAVFYDSSFWSMFFPIRKNLQIGLGLVNTVNTLELKAILAHEFGHFSQRTMKVGSYVYNVNQVIFNMLYENEGYQKLINSWSSVSGYFSIFISIAVKIIEGIQWVLKKLYEIVNKNYMALSREMEFNADEIAAYVVGSEPLKTSLVRLPFADHSFNSVLSFYDRKITSNTKSQNLFKEQLFAMNFQAAYNNFPVKGDLPEVTLEELNRFNKSKLVIKDQWSSHPSTEERIERLDRLNIPSQNSERTPANKIFKNIELIQQSLTDKIFEKVRYEGTTNSPSLEEFKTEYENEFLSNSFPKIYNGYYDNKNPTTLETNEFQIVRPDINVESLFSDQNVALVYQVIALKNDIEVLKQIRENNNDVNTFDYDGKKYEKRDTDKLLSELYATLEKANNEIIECDKMIFHYFKNKEQNANNSVQLEHLYRAFFKADNEFDSKQNFFTELSNSLRFISHTTSFDQIKTNLQEILPLEAKLKDLIKEILNSETCKKEITIEIKTNLDCLVLK